MNVTNNFELIIIVLFAIFSQNLLNFTLDPEETTMEKGENPFSQRRDRGLSFIGTVCNM